MLRGVIAGLFMAGLWLAGAVQAGQYNNTLSIGDPAPTFENLPGVDGKKHSLSELKDADVLVLIITCNSCPMAEAYEDRIMQLVKQYQGKAVVVALNVNKIDADSLPRMVERAKSKGFNFLYLYDESQKIAKDLGAAVTPECFVLNKQRKIVYMGAFDNDVRTPTVRYVEQAVEASLKGEMPVKQETRAFGCSVRYDKKRR